MMHDNGPTADLVDAFLVDCQQGNLQQIEELILQYPQIYNCKSSLGQEWNGFIVATVNHQFEVVRYLLNFPDIEVNLQDRTNKWTAMHYASFYGYTDIVQLIVQSKKANLHLRTLHNESIEDVCCKKDRFSQEKSQILMLLKRACQLSTANDTQSENDIEMKLVKQKDERIAELEDQLTQLRYSEEMKRDQLIRSYESSIKNLQKEISSQTDQIQQFQVEIESLKSNLQNKDLYILELEDDIKSQRRKLVDSQYSKKARAELIEEKNKEENFLLLIENLSTQLGIYKDDMTELQRLISVTNDIQNANDFEIFKEDMLKIIQETQLKAQNVNQQLTELFPTSVSSPSSASSSSSPNSCSNTSSLTSFIMNTTPIPVTLSIPTPHTEAFLAHDWGFDERNRNNHNRVSNINSRLKRFGLITWFDEQYLTHLIRHQMTIGLRFTKCVIVFITERYQKKIDSGDSRDNCFFEFDYFTRIFPNIKIFPIVMEERMNDIRNWQGRLNSELAGRKYVSEMIEDDEDILDTKCEELVKMIKHEIQSNP